jgi:hypothetical protein
MKQDDLGKGGSHMGRKGGFQKVGLVNGYFISEIQGGEKGEPTVCVIRIWRDHMVWNIQF